MRARTRRDELCCVYGSLEAKSLTTKSNPQYLLKPISYLFYNPAISPGIDFREIVRGVETARCKDVFTCRRELGITLHCSLSAIVCVNT